MTNIARFFLIGLLATTFLAACGEKDKIDPTPQPNLYERLGGIAAISAVVDQFIANVVADNVINARFAATVANPYRAELLRNNLIDQICAGTGGPCQYKGEDMKTAHAGMNISEAEFGALVADLIAALDKFKVPQKEKDELIAILAPMKNDIVGQ